MRRRETSTPPERRRRPTLLHLAVIAAKADEFFRLDEDAEMDGLNKILL